MDSVVHFEMPYENAERVARFYRTAFGWDTQLMGADINGGFFGKSADKPMQYPSVVISVADIAASMAKVNSAGGKVLGEPMNIPGVGRYVSFVDPEGNRVSLLQATSTAHG